MTVRIAPAARQQFLNAAGDPYVGAKLFTYVAGTTTKQATYTTSTGGVANTNPIILDASGRTPSGVWLTEGADYKFVLAPATDTDPPSSAIYTEDNIEGVNDASVMTAFIASLASSSGSTLVGDNDGAGGTLWTTIRGFIAYLASSVGSSIVGFIQAGTGAVARTVQAKCRERVTVSDFGAAGNGTTNDAAACLLADTAASSSGVIYPAGVYYIDTNTTLTAPITMMPGARFKVNAGKVLTINGPVYAGSRQYIFEAASAGVVGTFGRVPVWVDWFGAAPDSSVAAVPGGIDSGVGINKAIVAIRNSSWLHGVVMFNPGVYRIATKVYSATQGMTLRGAGKYQTILTCLAGYTSASGVVHLDGTNGAPINFSGFGVISAVGGTGGSDGIKATGNGVFISDVWVSGFSNGIYMDSTDQFLSEFVCEYNTSGVTITSTHCQVERGTTFLNNFAGVTISGVLVSEGGRVLLSEVRSNNEPANGFFIDTSSNVTLENCHVTHTDNSQYVTAGFNVINAGQNISFNGCTCYLGTVSTTSIGFKINTTSDVMINDCHVENFKTGVYLTSASNASVVGGMFNNNYYRGIDIDDFNFLTIANAQCHYQGTGGAADAGIFVLADRAAQRLIVNGCQCSNTGGGTQDYGIRVTCANATSYGIVSDNVASLNSVGQVTIDGANAANITNVNNIVV